MTPTLHVSPLSPLRARHSSASLTVRVLPDSARVLVGSVGYSIVWYGEKGLMNLGTAIVLAIAAGAVYTIVSHRKVGDSQ